MTSQKMHQSLSERSSEAHRVCCRKKRRGGLVWPKLRHIGRFSIHEDHESVAILLGEGGRSVGKEVFETQGGRGGCLRLLRRHRLPPTKLAHHFPKAPLALKRNTKHENGEGRCSLLDLLSMCLCLGFKRSRGMLRATHGDNCRWEHRRLRPLHRGGGKNQ